MEKHGTFIISLDFELYWGMRDIVSIGKYHDNLLGARVVIPKLLDLFQGYDIHATWAVVGFLFFRSRDELLSALPVLKPSYEFSRYSPYGDMSGLGKDERDDPFHFAPSLINLVKNHSGQEIGSHTLSHYYCLESGQELDSFSADLVAVKKAAATFGLCIRSLVLPRNQYNPEYAAACREAGITAYRGNEESWLYAARPKAQDGIVRRSLRLLDAYCNMSGYHTYELGGKRSDLLNLRASRFLRPFSPRLRIFEPFKIRRIKKAMTHAALYGQIYHLWWHPHNFGVHQNENLSQLRDILEHFKELRNKYGMLSRNMGEVASHTLSQLENQRL